jgi:uncharacterized repeat protein (TIGR01451 family)
MRAGGTRVRVRFLLRFAGLRMRKIFFESLGAVASKSRAAFSGFIVLCFWSTVASAQSNVHTFSCSEGFSSQLCKGNCTGSENNPDDILHITGVAAGSIITFSFTNVGNASSTNIKIDNQNSTTTPGSATFTVPPTSQSQFNVTSGPQANFQVLNTSSPPSGKAKVTYSVSCTPPPPSKGTIKFIKNTDSSENNGTFPISVGGGTPATVNVTTTNGTGTTTQDYAPGSYTIGEAPPSGWKLDSISCTGTAGSSGTTAVVVAGQTVTCTINNTKKVASLKLEKSVDQTKYTDIGQTLTYKLVATNTGNVDLTNFAISDPTATVGACSPVALGGTLAAGTSTTCTASYVTQETDIANKCVTNVATASGQDGSTTVTSAPATAKVCLTPDKTTETIHNFLERRVDLLASNEPDRARLMRRFDRPQQPVGSLKDEGGPMKLMGSSDANSTQLSFATSLSQLAQANAASAQSKAASAGGDPMRLGAMNSAPLYAPAIPFDVWVEGHFQKWDDDLAKADRSGNFGILYVGADYLVRPWLLIGALVQLDWMDDQSKLKNTEVSGNGWMAGPYVSMKLSDNIYFDARGAWGQSDNSVNPFGTYTDSFDTDRWLAKANLTGDWHFDRFRVSPSVGVIYVEETQHSYVDSLGFTIPEQSVHVGRLTFGPEFGYEILAHDGSIIEPHVSFTGIWDFDGGPNTIIDGLVTSQDDLRLKIEGGLLVHSAYGTAFRGTVSYDGIGTDNFSAWGGQLWVSLPLH